MCLSLFQIQNLCQFWAKSGFSQKDTHTAFSFLFFSVLLSCQHHLKGKFGMYFAQPSFCVFEWCAQRTKILVLYAYSNCSERMIKSDSLLIADCSRILVYLSQANIMMMCLYLLICRCSILLLLVHMYQGGHGCDSPQRSPNTMKAYINE